MNNRLLIFTGAGISAESGLSTFRDKDGLWTKYDIEEVCNFVTFKKVKDNPQKREKIFEFYNNVKESILKAEPNDAHRTVANWQKKYGPERVKIFTANIDDLFERAGAEEVCHVHGEIFNMHCAACGHTWHIGDAKYISSARCNKCNSRLTKPNIVFFNEMAPEYEVLHSAFNLKRRDPKDIILYVGSSMSVIPPSRLIQTRANKLQNVLVNLEPQSEDDLFGHKYYGKATEQLQLVDEQIIKSNF